MKWKMEDMFHTGAIIPDSLHRVSNDAERAECVSSSDLLTIPPPLLSLHPQSLHSPQISTFTALPLYSPSSPHLSHTQPEVKEAFSFRAGGGVGELAFRSPSSMALYARTPGPSTWQCDNVAGLFKRDPVCVKCFSPWRATAGQGQGAWKVLVKERGHLWSQNVKGWTFWLTLAGGAGFCFFGFWIVNLTSKHNV